MNESSGAIHDIINANTPILIAGFLLLASVTGSILLQNKIKEIAISIDDKLYNIGTNHGKNVRTLIWPIQFVLPSNPLRAYVDYRTAVSLQNDNIIDLSTISKTEDQENPARDWRVGFTLQSVMSGLTVDRQNADGDSVTDELITELESEEGIIVVGRPGSGKSTICKQVACEWYQQERGPVLYRESGHGPVTDEAALIETIQRTPPDQTLLIVLEDVCNSEHIDIIDTLQEHRGDNIQYLTDSRINDLETLLESRTLDTVRSRQTASALSSEFKRYPAPNLNVDECQRIINEYERITGEQVVESAESIYQRIENSTDAGQMLMLTYEISSDSAGLENDGPTRLEIDVKNKHGEISNPANQDSKLRLDQYNQELLYKVCFSINLYNVIDFPITESGLLIIGDENDRNETRRIIRSLEGWMLFKNETIEEYEEFETFHELWSTYYLRHILKNRSADSHKLFLNSINSVLDGLDTKEKIEIELVEGSGEYEMNHLIYYFLVDIYQKGRTLPAISELFTEIDIDDLHIPEKLRPEIDAELVAERSFALLQIGDYERAEDEINNYHEIVKRMDRVDQNVLGNFYGYSLANIYINSGRYIEARQILSELLEDYKGDELTKAHILKLYGAVTANTGEFQESVYSSNKALEIAQDYGEKGLEQNILMNLGIAFENAKEYKLSEDHYERSVEVAEQTGDSHSLAKANHNLGKIIFRRAANEIDVNRIQEAKGKLEYSYRIKQDIGDRIGQGNTLGSLSNMYQETGDLDTAEEYAKESMSIAEQHGNNKLIAASYHNYGLILKKRLKIDEAESYLLTSCAIHSEAGNIIEKYRSLQVLVGLQLLKGDLDSAVDYEILALEICLDARDTVTARQNIQFLDSVSTITNDLPQKIEIKIIVIENRFRVMEIGADAVGSN